MRKIGPEACGPVTPAGEESTRKAENVKLAVTIDVEEEGLFSGEYRPDAVQVANVERLETLDSLFTDLEIRPTLMTAHSVARVPRCAEIVLRLRDKWNGEIGGHLHAWNTPPFKKLPYPAPVPSEMMPEALLRSKTTTLFESLAAMGVEPRSFRMGRFNLGPKMLRIIEEFGIEVDSSVAPMRSYYGGPDHLAAPTDPYFPDPADPCRPGDSPVLEAPMTIVPVVENLGGVLESMRSRRILPGALVSGFAKYIGSLPAQPLWTGTNRLRKAVRLHRRRGGRALTIFFHSSELLPGGCPQHATDKDVRRFIEKLRRFFTWLRSDVGVDSLTLSELGDLYRSSRRVDDRSDRGGFRTEADSR